MDLTPVQRVSFTLGQQTVACWVKRDDLFEMAKIRGGKVRTCWHLAQQAKPGQGLVTASSRMSPQISIVSRIGAEMKVPVRVHVPKADAPSDELADAKAHGATIIEHKPGYNSVIIARAWADCRSRNWVHIPFGMECQEAVDRTAEQVANLPLDAKRIVIPVGSGMSAAGVLHGLQRASRSLPVLGVCVGADPSERLDRWAPFGWRRMLSLEPAGVDYHVRVACHLGGIVLDPVYEAKCVDFIGLDDVFWIVGVRATV